MALPAHSQIKIEPRFPGEPVTILPSDAEILASAIERKDLPCTVTPRKAQLGFDLQFHTGFDVNVPLNELEGGDDMLTIVFRVYPEGNKGDANYFSEHITVPKIEDDAAGDAFLQGYFNVGVGNYHVDWLMRDRQERLLLRKLGYRCHPVFERPGNEALHLTPSGQGSSVRAFPG